MSENANLRWVRGVVCPSNIFSLLSYFFLAINVASFPSYGQSGSFFGGNEFGWPYTYATSPWTSVQQKQAQQYAFYVHSMEDYAGFISPEIGPWSNDTTDLNLKALVANAFICLGITLVTVFACIQFPFNRDNRRRRQVSLGSLLFVCASLAVMTCCITSRYSYHFYVEHQVWFYFAFLVAWGGLAVAAICGRLNAMKAGSLKTRALTD